MMQQQQQQSTPSTRGPSPLERQSSCPAIICHSTRKPLFVEEEAPVVDSPSNGTNKKRRRHSFGGFSTDASSIIISSISAEPAPTTSSSESSAFRKARVAITGGTLTAVGLVMIPLPIPMGFVVATAGMAHLGQEFPVAQQLLDSTKEQVVKAFQNSTTKPKEEETTTPTKKQQQPEDWLPESPQSIRAVWEIDEEEQLNRWDHSPGYHEEEVMVNVWQAY